jgi:hypothetical protein
MTIQLNLTCSDCEDGVVPRLSPREGQDLLVAHCELVKSTAARGAKQRMARQVLLLCHALWAELPALASESTPALISNARRNAFCDWLQAVICEEEQANAQQAASREHKYLQQLFQGKLVDCVRECQEAGDHCLSLIVASAGSSSATKSMFQQQVISILSFVIRDRKTRFFVKNACMVLHFCGFLRFFFAQGVFYSGMTFLHPKKQSWP